MSKENIAEVHGTQAWVGVKSLVIGGSSGLGLELVKLLHEKGSEVYITGRRNPNISGIKYINLDIGDREEQLRNGINKLVSKLPSIDLLIFAAGYYQEGSLTDLNEDEIQKMVNVGLTAPIYFVRQLLKIQEELLGFIAITSTSQWTPRLLEPIYTVVKAGLGAFTNSASLDPRIKKSLVVGPAGMKTNFWKDTKKDTSTMLDPKWVAGEVLKLYDDAFSYRFIRILREPPRVEVVETRK